MEDLESLRSHFDFEKISIIGWSYSGLIAVLYADIYSDYVSKVIQIGSLPPKKVPYFEDQQKTLNSRKDSLYRIRIQSI